MNQKWEKNNRSHKSKLTNQIAFADIINPETGEVLVEKDGTITDEIAKDIQNSGINIVDVKINDRKVPLRVLITFCDSFDT